MLYTVNRSSPLHTSLQNFRTAARNGNEEKQHLQVSPETLVSPLKLGLCHPFHGCGAHLASNISWLQESSMQTHAIQPLAIILSSIHQGASSLRTLTKPSANLFLSEFFQSIQLLEEQRSCLELRTASCYGRQPISGFINILNGPKLTCLIGKADSHFL